MKKSICLALAALLLICYTVPAAAATHFDFSTSATSGFPRWTESQESTGANWHIEWKKGTNIGSNRRAVVRALCNGEFASSLFVYSTRSTKYHPYKDGYGHGDADTYVGGRLDNRDHGTLHVVGWFFN